MSVKKKAAFLGLLFLLLAVLFFLFRDFSSAERPNIIVIVMDTVRADHLSCYGYEKKTTPQLEKLVESSRIFHKAYTPGGWTPPAHASLFTGLYSTAHKVTQENWTMSEKLLTLAEVLSGEGYETLGIVENPMLTKYHNFHQGFQNYYESWKEKKEYKGNKSLFPFRKHIKSQKKNKPLFCFINFIAPHSPYNSSKGFYDTFLTDESISVEANHWVDYYIDRINFSPEEFQHLNELYDAEILYTDFLIGEIINLLKNHRLWENTLFVVTSDHGENIGDHGLVDHVFSLHESIIKIPLIIHYPKMFSPGTEDHKPALLVDIFPTVLSAVGLKKKNFFFQGVDLTKIRRGDRLIFSEYYYPKQVLQKYPPHIRQGPKLEKYRRRIRAVIDGGYKLIWGSDGAHQLYNLKESPDEKRNLIQDEEKQQKVKIMMKKLEMLKKKYKMNLVEMNRQRKEKMDEETLKALKSLGYIH